MDFKILNFPFYLNHKNFNMDSDNTSKIFPEKYLVLPKKLKRSDFTLEQIDRVGNVALYIARNPKDYEQIKGYILTKKDPIGWDK
tara:strand:- start:583 stop:837 length:255 start_codon:yes stop_codon:yes gene_type:complete